MPAHMRPLAAVAAFVLTVTVFGPIASVGAVTFKSAVQLATGNGPVAVAVGNLNADAVPDIAVANRFSENVSVYLGDGAGGFSAPTTYAAGLSPSGLAVASLGFSRPDLVVTNRTMDTVSILRNNGDGTFQAPLPLPAGSDPYAVRAADLDLESGDDAIVVNRSAGAIAVLRNDGWGSFQPPVSYDVGTQPAAVATEDFDANSYPDIAVANTFSADVSVLMNNGDGTFAEATSAPVGAEPQAIATADFNGDGFVDIAVGLGYSGKVVVIFGDGAGGFTPALPKNTYSVGADASTLAAADLDGQYGSDLVVGDAITDRLTVLMNLGNGTFAAQPSPVDVGQDPRSLVVTDVVADLAPDLLVSEFRIDRLTLLPVSGYPDTIITNHPSASSHTHSAAFRFESTEPGATFECSLDGAAWAPCTSPFVIGSMGLSDGPHSFAVRATDTDAMTDPTPATWDWTITTVSPGPWPACSVRPTYCIASFTIDGKDMMADPNWRIWAEFLDADNGVDSFDWAMQKWSVDHWGQPDGTQYAVTLTINSGDIAPRLTTAVARNMQQTTAGDAAGGYFTTVKASPIVINWKTSPVGGNCYAGQCGDASTLADIAETALSGNVQDLGMWGRDAELFDGMWIATNAQYSTFPVFSDGPTPYWSIDLGNPHLKLDGAPATGSFGVYVPPSTLAGMRLSQAKAAAAGLKVTRTDGGAVSTVGAAVMPSTDGGVYLRIPALTYSTPTLSITAEPGDKIAIEPDAPHEVAAAPLADAALVTFEAPFFDGGVPISAYDVRCANGGSTQDVTAPPTTSVQVTGLTNGDIWDCSVRAENEAGPGPWSYSVSVTPDAGAPAPDTTPPDTTLDSAPADPDGSRNATFAFASDEAPPAFRCRLDAGAWQACASPHTFHGLSDGSHTVEVAAIDAAANVDASAVAHTWTVDATPPDTTLDSAPSGTLGATQAGFTFSGSDAGGTGVTGFRCKLDADPWSDCTSPASYDGLSDGGHTFRVRAVDAAGNTDPTPPLAVWSVNTAPRVDAMIKGPKDRAYIGDDIYDAAGAKQVRRLSLNPGARLTLQVKIQNDALVAGEILVRAGKPPKGVKVTYLTGGTNITGQVVGTGYTSMSLEPGAQIPISVKVAVGRTATGSKAFLISAVASSNPSVVDAVGAALKIKK